MGEQITEQPNVRIFTTPTCPYCRQAREYLKRRGIEFIEHDISSDPQAMKEMVWLSGQRGVPVIVVGREVVVGFDMRKLNVLLASQLQEKPRPRLGLQIATVNPESGLPTGAYVGNVEPRSPADLAGIRENDVIIEIDRRPVHSSEDVKQILNSALPGQRVPISVWRNGRIIRFVANLYPTEGGQ